MTESELWALRKKEGNEDCEKNRRIVKKGISRIKFRKGWKTTCIRQVLYMVYIDSMTYAEIADKINFSERQIARYHEEGKYILGEMGIWERD